ncbi:MAG: hypothetical protein SVZ03_06400 [Spirochaetota bacterium]|nr:hypothetical protein [Spirochaetota bacterium]
MKKTDDTKLYRYFSIITLIIAIILALISYYSILIVEPKVKELLSMSDNINDNYKEAYIELKNPQLFAGYNNYDAIARPIESIKKNFNNKIDNNEEFEINDKIYLSILLERRMLGSRLGRNTMIFFLMLSALGFVFCLYEIKQKKTRSID